MIQRKGLSKLRGVSYETSKLQDNIAAVLEPLLTNPLNYGIILDNLVLDGVNSLIIPHLLTRQPVGWLVVDKTSNINPFRVSWDSRTIELNATTAGTVSIYIF